jgi:hypothetical protein
MVYLVTRNKCIRKTANNGDSYVDCYFNSIEGICGNEEDAKLFAENLDPNSTFSNILIVPIEAAPLITYPKDNGEIKQFIEGSRNLEKTGKKIVIEDLWKRTERYIDRINNGSSQNFDDEEDTKGKIAFV